MKRIISLIFLATSICAISQPTNRRSFNDGWLFTLTDSIQYSTPEYCDTAWAAVKLPHDWSRAGIPSPTLASCTGYLPGGIGWYRKHFNHQADSNTLTKIYFEGIYNRSEIYLNGHLVGSRPNGYVSTEYDLTPWLNDGENLISVRVDHSRYADSRWYTGSGIYRDVWLYTKPSHHIDLWGLKYYCSDISTKRATINIDVIMGGEPLKNAKLKIDLYNQEGKSVATRIIPAMTDTCHTSFTIKNPHLWSLETPYLYKLTASLILDGKVIDSEIAPVGIRSIKFDPNTGFALNGKNMKLKGVCLHHDAGVLGSAVPPLVIKQRLLKLKELGTNAIRCSHNPQSPVFYSLCDSLGFLVMDEGSDEWEFPKRKWVKGWNVGTPVYDGTADFFQEWIEKDITDMVRRDRNHPSIILWSVGNEVDYPNDPYSHPSLDNEDADFSQQGFGKYNPEAPNAERIGVIAKRIATCIRQADSSRPVTGALAGVYMSNHTSFPDVIDVVGYNYTETRYAQDHQQYPNRIIYGSENRSDYTAWKAVRDNEYISGQFIWTGADYLGESGRWPSRGLGTGLLDFSNHLKPRGYFRQSLWSDSVMAYLGTYPRMEWLSTDAPARWNYREGMPVRVVCYTNAPQATLYLNDSIIGKTATRDTVSGIIHWDTVYHPGTLTVIATDGNNIVATDTIHTLERPHHMQAQIIARDNTHAIVELSVYDDKGNLCTMADNEVFTMVKGGKLLGVESGDNRDMSEPSSMRRRFYNGTLTAYIELQPSQPVTVSFMSTFLNPCSVNINQ